jgi:hypothetical protein
MQFFPELSWSILYKNPPNSREGRIMSIKEFMTQATEKRSIEKKEPKDKLHAELLLDFYNGNLCLLNPPFGKRSFETEVPYNYFGERGTVDFVDYWKDRNLGPYKDMVSLIELKTELIDIGETIRQVKKAKNYFAKGFTGQIGNLPFVDRHDLLLTTSHLFILYNKKNVMDFMKYETLFESAKIKPIFWNMELHKPIHGCCAITSCNQTDEGK